MRYVFPACCAWTASGAARRPPARVPRNARRSIRSGLLRGCRDRRRMMVHDQPTPASIPIDKAETSRQACGFAVPNTRKSVGPSINGRLAIDADPLLTDDALELWRHAWQTLEVVANGSRIVTERGRDRAASAS